MKVIIQSMVAAPLRPRYAREKLLEALADTPAVLLHGPRQCGKTTLAKSVGEPLGYSYHTFDDDNLRAAATNDPIGFVADLPSQTILDEIQRVPELFLALKDAIDRDRRPGRFILTGSANVLLVPKLADSLAGRMEIQRLHPLAQCEIGGKPSTFIDRLFVGDFKTARRKRLGSELMQRVIAGGYPAALARAEGHRRREWHRNYVEAIIQRDVRDLGRIRSLDALPKLMQLAAAQTSRLLNVSDLAAPFELTRPTIRDYTTLLERVFLIDILGPWHNNQMSRLVKTPKLHMVDSGLAAALLGTSVEMLKQDGKLYGQLLETFVVQELRRLSGWQQENVSLHHFRLKDNYEVDVVLERGAFVLTGVEVKASSTVTSQDFRGLRKLKEEAGKRFKIGVVLYDGEQVIRFEEGLFAVPISLLWED